MSQKGDTTLYALLLIFLPPIGLIYACGAGTGLVMFGIWFVAIVAAGPAGYGIGLLAFGLLGYGAMQERNERLESQGRKK